MPNNINKERIMYELKGFRLVKILTKKIHKENPEDANVLRDIFNNYSSSFNADDPIYEFCPYFNENDELYSIDRDGKEYKLVENSLAND